MTIIDKQRIDAVRVLEGLGYAFAGDEWKAPDGAAPSFIRSADMMHWLLMRRADELTDCEEGSAEECELEAIADVLEAYESIRWPEGKIPGGKG
jgi:hypothetical protein